MTPRTIHVMYVVNHLNINLFRDTLLLPIHIILYMRISKTKMVTRNEEIISYTCDNCNEQFKYVFIGGCPVEAELLPLFVGFESLQVSVYGDEPNGSKHGVQIGDFCRECRDNWFKDILERYPSAKMITIND